MVLKKIVFYEIFWQQSCDPVFEKSSPINMSEDGETGLSPPFASLAQGGAQAVYGRAQPHQTLLSYATKSSY